MAKIELIPVGKFAVGYRPSNKASLLRFEWTDRDPINLISEKHAVAMALAILQNYKKAPPKRSQMN
jgi:hypothetical protein